VLGAWAGSVCASSYSGSQVDAAAESAVASDRPCYCQGRCKQSHPRDKRAVPKLITSYRLIRSLFNYYLFQLREADMASITIDQQIELV
jgi:hypothetical protein